MIRQVEYFEKPGPVNTERCLDIAVRLAEEGVKDFVVASTSGRTGRQVADALAGPGRNVVIVAHSVGFKEAGRDEFDPACEARIVEKGGRVFRGSILTHSLEMSLSAAYGGTYPTQIIAASLRRLGDGIKVACEIVMEACDAGLIEEGVETAAIAGSDQGADTVALVRARPSKRFLELKVLEILAKPRG